MFRLFRRRKKEMVSMELPVHNYDNMNNQNYQRPVQPVSRPTNQPDSKMARLMELIGHAIDDWAVEYHMENLPKKIVFDQAFDAMRAIETMMNNRER